jgi:hypothetical protein
VEICLIEIAPTAPYGPRMVLSCVIGFLPSLLYLAPVLVMVGLVVVAKARGRTDDDAQPAEPAPSAPQHEHLSVT